MSIQQTKLPYVNHLSSRPWCAITVRFIHASTISTSLERCAGAFQRSQTSPTRWQQAAGTLQTSPSNLALSNIENSRKIWIDFQKRFISGVGWQCFVSLKLNLSTRISGLSWQTRDSMTYALAFGGRVPRPNFTIPQDPIIMRFNVGPCVLKTVNAKAGTIGNCSTFHE